ncbi:MAG TPA: ABC transporter ATP-binding protein [Kofleriaceae bacterium]|nr:ABC transporter ATP-binding protein [Kofleriaceae bacterium]
MDTQTKRAGVEARGLGKTFSTPSGPLAAVNGIDLAIPAGETVALLGANGAGKSTTIDMLLGLTPPDRGEVRLFGLAPAAAVAAGKVAAMLQTGELVRDVSIRELVAMAGSLYPAPRPVDEVLREVGIAELSGRRTERLSGGQAQRVRFALALVGNADLLVFDEPTVGMDVEARREFWRVVRSTAARGKTIVFATHYLEEADSYADRIVVMAGGRIIADGAATEIKARAGARTIKATLPGVALAALEALPGVTRAERRGDAVTLACGDSDRAIRALLASHADARDIEVAGVRLEEAFVALTASPAHPSLRSAA